MTCASPPRTGMSLRWMRIDCGDVSATWYPPRPIGAADDAYVPLSLLRLPG